MLGCGQAPEKGILKGFRAVARSPFNRNNVLQK